MIYTKQFRIIYWFSLLLHLYYIGWLNRHFTRKLGHNSISCVLGNAESKAVSLNNPLSLFSFFFSPRHFAGCNHWSSEELKSHRPMDAVANNRIMNKEKKRNKNFDLGILERGRGVSLTHEHAPPTSNSRVTQVGIWRNRQWHENWNCCRFINGKSSLLYFSFSLCSFLMPG